MSALLDLAHHLVEGGDQCADLVVAVALDAARVVALVDDLARRRSDRQDRAGDDALQAVRHEQRDQHRQQRDRSGNPGVCPDAADEVVLRTQVDGAQDLPVADD
ncbi:MAG TPA: hypothetical protein VFF72_12055, partial [Caldimonas sp.]|nr:hypothetical protein [Caldimonas sp.]